MTVVQVCYVLALVVALIAAVTDTRTGHIPNWLTFPTLVIGPVLHFFSTGLDGLLKACLGIVICGLVPFLLFQKDAIGGGDVKLFAAIGGLLGAMMGLEAQFWSFVIALVYGFSRLAWQGKLLRALGNSGRIMLNPVLPKRLRREVSPELMTAMRLGGAIFAGTLVSMVARYKGLWP